MESRESHFRYHFLCTATGNHRHFLESLRAANAKT